MSSDPEEMKSHPAHPESAPAAAPSAPGAPPAYTSVDLSEEQPGTTNVTVVTGQPTAQVQGHLDIFWGGCMCALCQKYT